MDNTCGSCGWSDFVWPGELVCSHPEGEDESLLDLIEWGLTCPYWKEEEEEA